MRTAATDSAKTIRAALPGGLWEEDGEPIRQVEMRTVGGDDELFVLDAQGQRPAAQATALLERCVLDPHAVIDSLTIGDREALLLQLRQVTLGDDLDCLLDCPSDGCGEQLELRMSINDMLLAPYDEVHQQYSARFTVHGREHHVEFRLPRTADLDAAASTNPEWGATALLRACVRRVTIDDRAASVDDLDPLAVTRVADEMLARDPQAEIRLDARCPACGHRFDALFDTGSFLLQELQARAQRLVADVHLLALHYHWSERDILAMSASRRDHYLDLLGAEFARRST